VKGLPVLPPVEPMLAKRVDSIPRGEGYLFEPKWDGFRALVFRDGPELYLQSRDKKALNRYFPELEGPLLGALPERVVVDGEIVIARDGGLDFEALQLRIHPAASRVALLAAELPASIVLWDILSLGDDDLMKTPFEERRARLAEAVRFAAPVHLTPMTRDRAVAEDWFERFEGAGLDGVMAKPARGSYEPKKRTMLKVKHQRTVDCVVAAFRWHKNSDASAAGGGDRVGSLLLGLYDARGVLHHIGVAASFSDQKRRELVATLAPLRSDLSGHPWQDWQGDDESQRRPGGPSRWNRGKDTSFVPLRPELVVEVSYDHMQGTRLRHTAHFSRWRPDKPPAECTYDQLEVVPPLELVTIFAS
jgi:ATP-dependent DNA ligase